MANRRWWNRTEISGELLKHWAEQTIWPDLDAYICESARVSLDLSATAPLLVERIHVVPSKGNGVRLESLGIAL